MPQPSKASPGDGTPVIDEKADRAMRTVVLVVVSIIVVATAFTYYRKVDRGSSAFIRWRPQIAQLVRGEDVYRVRDPYPNPPIMAIALAPLAALPPTLGAMVFFAIKVGLAGAAVVWSLRLAAGERDRWPWLWIGLVILLGLRTIMSDLQHGNVNIVILFLVVAAAYAFRQGRDGLAGLAIALGIAFKVTPGLLLVYFAYKRQWKVVAATGVGLVLFLLVLPSLVVGPARNWDLLNGWADALVWPYVKKGTTEYTLQINQSLPGLYTRLVTDVPGIEWDDEQVETVNLVSIDPDKAKWGLKAMVLGLVGLLAWLCRTPTTNRRDWRLACEVGLVLIAMLWISERSWKHHHVTMLLPFACVVAGFALHDLPARVRKVLAGLLIASIALIVLTTEGGSGWLRIDEEGNLEGHKYLLAYGGFFLSVVAIFVGLALAVRSRPTTGSMVD